MSGNNCGDDFLSEIYHSLRAPRRRYVIKLLAATDKDVLSVRFLAQEIAAHEQDITPDSVSGEPYRNVYNALSQTHLATLSDANIVIYNKKRQTVAEGSNLTIANLLSNLNKTAYRTLKKEKMEDNDQQL